MFNWVKFAEVHRCLADNFLKYLEHCVHVGRIYMSQTDLLNAKIYLTWVADPDSWK